MIQIMRIMIRMMTTITIIIATMIVMIATAKTKTNQKLKQGLQD